MLGWVQASSLNNVIKILDGLPLVAHLLGLVFLLSSPWMMMMNTMAIMRIYAKQT